MRLEYHTADRDNYGDRHYRIPDMVVIHTAEGSLHSAVNWFQDPESRVSAHYVVGRDGLVVACVPEGNCAWHAGNREVNWRSIGIECEGEADKAETWTAELLASLTELCADLAIRHRIPVMRTNNGPGFAGHCDVPDPRDPARRGGVNHKTDPGPWFPWPTFLDSVQSRVNAAADMAAVPAGPGEENSA